MTVFLDTSKRRKLYFRGFIILIFALAFSIAGLAVFNMLFGSATQSPAVKYADTVQSYHYYYSPANKNKIALTFDDGPRPGITRDLMNILDKNKIPATFFFIGQEILLQPNIVREVSKRGFDIGNHSFTHREDIHDSQNRLALELHATGYLISKITGKIPEFYRPPFLLGIGIDPTVNPYIPIPKDVLWSLEDGYIPTGTDIDPKDWLATSPTDVVNEIEATLKNSTNGHIILLHEEAYTVDALQNIIDMLRDKGYEFTSLHNLLTPPKQITLTQTMHLGATDATTNGEVSKLQWFLYGQGDLDPYLLTGTFGQETRNALTSFQLRNNLINPNNVDPTRAGVTDEATRDMILALSKQSIVPPAVTPSVSLFESVATTFGDIVVSAYVDFVPAIRIVLIWMVRLALGIVIFRCLFIGIVFAYRWYEKKYLTAKKIVSEHTKQKGVSILIPAYNEEENIRSTIESVVKSTYETKEIIVINDGSTDTTGKIVQSIIDNNPTYPIKLLTVENGGKATALNHGINISTYDICVVIDADAVLDPYALYYFTEHFVDPSVGAVAGRVNTTSSSGFLNLFQKLEYAIGQNIDKKVLSTMSAVGVVPGPAGAWDKASVISAGGFNVETLVEDQDMTLTLLRMGKKIIYDERAISYTETPDTVTNFLKQRFRWVYGTTQCFWKNKRVFIEKPLSVMSLVVMPNILIFNILLPITYPFADISLIVGLIFGEWQTMLLPLLLFTLFDIAYAYIGIHGETDRLKLLSAVPLQRISYRQLLYYTVIRSVVRAIEGTGSGWNKFAKSGETQRFYFSSIENVYTPETLTPASMPSPWIDGMITSTTNLNEQG